MTEMKNRLFERSVDEEPALVDHSASGTGREGAVIDIHKKWDRLLSVASSALDISREKAGNDID